MNKPRKRKYAVICQVCEKEFLSARADTKTCSVVCRKQLHRDVHYVGRFTRRVYNDLQKLVELAGEDSLPEYRGPAWVSLVGLSSYLAKVVSEKSLRELELYQPAEDTEKA